MDRIKAYRVQQELNSNGSVPFAADYQKLQPYLAALESYKEPQHPHRNAR